MGMITGLKAKLETGAFAVLAEIDPPKGADVTAAVESAEAARDYADAFLVTDMNSGIMRMSALAFAAVLKKRGIASVMQMGCRNRNRLALQSDLLGAFACGIDQIAAVPGDDPAGGDHHETRAADDMDRIQLLETIRMLESGRDMAGNELQGAASFVTGASVMAGSEGETGEKELAEAEQLIEAGAAFLVTQPVFDPSDLSALKTLADRRRTGIIPTVLLLKSLGMARYMARNVPHIRIPQTLIKRIQKSKDKTGECEKIASETIAAFKAAGFSGVSVSTMGAAERIPHLVEGL